MIFKVLLSISLLFTTTPVLAQEGDAALRDLEIGLAGLQEAAKNPALLAQLMQDLQVNQDLILGTSTRHDTCTTTVRPLTC